LKLNETPTIMKKHKLRVYYQTYCDVEVLSNLDETNIKELCELKTIAASRADEIISRHAQFTANMEQSDVELLESSDNLFNTKDDAYNALDEHVGYYAAINSHRPTFVVGDMGAIEAVTIKAVISSCDTSSPLKMIDENDNNWDIHDYLSKEGIEMLYQAVILNEC
jgi:hypothetical protein